jgi:hypothetical protein
MNFKTFTLIVARSHYLSNNIVTGMLYCTEQLIITIFVQEMTLPKNSLVSSHTDPAQPSTSRSSSNPPSKRKRNSRNGTSDSALGWSFLDQQPSLPQFSEQSGSTTAVDDSSTTFDFFSIFFPECTIKHIKTETNRYAKSIADKLRRTNKLRPHSIWQTWTGVRLHEM